MTITEFKTIVGRAKENNPVWFGLDADPSASEAEILVAEAALKIKLPSDYCQFVREFGGGYFAFTNVFSVSPSSDWNIVKKNKLHRINAFIAVSDNGVGDLFGFRSLDGICLPEIWVSDHENQNNLMPTSYKNLLNYLAERGLKSHA